MVIQMYEPVGFPGAKDVSEVSLELIHFIRYQLMCMSCYNLLSI
jgi:hypothetical protein